MKGERTGTRAVPLQSYILIYVRTYVRTYMAMECLVCLVYILFGALLALIWHSVFTYSTAAVIVVVIDARPTFLSPRGFKQFLDS